MEGGGRAIDRSIERTWRGSGLRAGRRGARWRRLSRERRTGSGAGAGYGDGNLSASVDVELQRERCDAKSAGWAGGQRRARGKGAEARGGVRVGARLARDGSIARETREVFSRRATPPGARRTHPNVEEGDGGGGEAEGGPQQTFPTNDGHARGATGACGREGGSAEDARGFRISTRLVEARREEFICPCTAADV